MVPKLGQVLEEEGGEEAEPRPSGIPEKAPLASRCKQMINTAGGPVISERARRSPRRGRRGVGP